MLFRGLIILINEWIFLFQHRTLVQCNSCYAALIIKRIFIANYFLKVVPK